MRLRALLSEETRIKEVPEVPQQVRLGSAAQVSSETGKWTEAVQSSSVRVHISNKETAA